MIKWLKNMFRPKDASVQKIIDLEDFMGQGGGWSVSGRPVNESAALKASAVFACVRLISGAVATAPCLVYSGSRFEKTRTPAPDHRLSPILLKRPNNITTAATFWKAMTGDKLLHGNAYALIQRNPAGRPVGLYRIRPERMTVYQAWERGLDKKLGVSWDHLFYEVRFDDGRHAMFDQSDVIHVPNLGWDGKQGVSTLKAGVESMAGFLNAQEHSARFFKQGASFEFVLSFPKVVTKENAELIREYFAKAHGGVTKSHLPPLLSEGGEVKPTNMSAKDAQLLESRVHGVVDICRYFGVPPVMIGETSKTTSWGSGVEQMARWFATFTLNDHFTAFEQELESKLFAGGGFFPEFDEEELVRGDTKTQYEAFKIARGSMQDPGILTVNEIRQALGYSPIEGGDVIMRPAENGGAPDAGPTEGTV